MKPHLLCFGFGYSARALLRSISLKSWKISATSRSEQGLSLILASGHHALSFPAPASAFGGVTHILISAPPSDHGDPVLRAHDQQLRALAPSIKWLGYLSTTGVYGDAGGGWVDEHSPLAPNTDRGKRRLEAETAWLNLYETCGLPVHIFRLAGIYGPNRNQLQAILDGSAKRIVKAGQIFSRIHVDDIAGVIEASIAKPSPGRAYNVCDDEPGPPQDVIAYAASLLGKPPPEVVPFDEAVLSAMARSFYSESKRVSNARIKQELGYRLRYPNYRDGLKAHVQQALLPSLSVDRVDCLKRADDHRP